MVRSELEKEVLYCKERPWHPNKFQGYCILSAGKKIISCNNLNIDRIEEKEWYNAKTGMKIAECYGCGNTNK
jgi:hypothetical protein